MKFMRNNKTENSRSKFHGVDLDQDSINRANQKLSKSGLKNVTFERKDIFKTKNVEKVDVILMFLCLHDLYFPTECLRL